MPNGGIRLSIDLSSSAIAATADRDGARIPVMLNGRFVMPYGITVDPAGQLYVGVTAPPEPSANQQFIPDPLQLLGPTEADPPVDAVQLLAGQLWHIADQATRQAGGPVAALAVTIPSAWGPRRRGHLTDAAARAGLPAPPWSPHQRHSLPTRRLQVASRTAPVCSSARPTGTRSP